MQSNIYIDPKIDIASDEYIGIIIEFKIKPAKTAVATCISNLTIEQAKQQVETSHQTFQRELKRLEESNIEYFIINTYKDSFNGVSMRLKENTVQRLLRSTVIKAIYKTVEMNVPKKPGDTRYQI